MIRIKAARRKAYKAVEIELAELKTNIDLMKVLGRKGYAPADLAAELEKARARRTELGRKLRDIYKPEITFDQLEIPVIADDAVIEEILAVDPLTMVPVGVNQFGSNEQENLEGLLGADADPVIELEDSPALVNPQVIANQSTGKPETQVEPAAWATGVQEPEDPGVEVEPVIGATEVWEPEIPDDEDPARDDPIAWFAYFPVLSLFVLSFISVWTWCLGRL